MGKVLVFMIELPFKLTKKFISEVFTAYNPQTYADKLQGQNKKLSAIIRKLQTDVSVAYAGQRKKEKLIRHYQERIKELEQKLKEKR